MDKNISSFPINNLSNTSKSQLMQNRFKKICSFQPGDKNVFEFYELADNTFACMTEDGLYITKLDKFEQKFEMVKTFPHVTLDSYYKINTIKNNCYICFEKSGMEREIGLMDEELNKIQNFQDPCEISCLCDISSSSFVWDSSQE